MNASPMALLFVHLYLVFLLVTFCASVAISIAALFLAWRMGPKKKKDSIACFLSIVLVSSLWVFMLSKLYYPLWQDGTIGDWYTSIIYAILVGATPASALPGIYLFAGKRRRSS